MDDAWAEWAPRPQNNSFVGLLLDAPEWARTTSDYAVHKALNRIRGVLMGPGVSRLSSLLGFAGALDGLGRVDVVTVLSRRRLSRCWLALLLWLNPLDLRVQLVEVVTVEDPLYLELVPGTRVLFDLLACDQAAVCQPVESVLKQAL